MLLNRCNLKNNVVSFYKRVALPIGGLNMKQNQPNLAIFISILPLLAYLYLQGFYVVIYKESAIARVLAVSGMLIFTILCSIAVYSAFIHTQKDKSK